MKHPKPSKISVIVTTYNWPQALRLVLQALSAQKTSIPFEIIIADDGSTQETVELIQAWQKRMPVPLIHIWQEDKGFRVSTIRNKALLASTSDYIIFLDGDCIPQTTFIACHYALAEKGYFIAGNRVLLNKLFTITVLSELLPLHQWALWQWLLPWMQGYCNRLIPFLKLPLGKFRFTCSKRWQGAKGCNLAVWKQDVIAINGWEELFTGWGYEDSEFVIRLIRMGIHRKEGRQAVPVIHLWHPENDRSQESHNLKKLEECLQKSHLQAECGVNQHLSTEMVR